MLYRRTPKQHQYTHRSFCTKTVWEGPSGPYKSTCSPVTAWAQGISCRCELPTLAKFVGCQQQPSTRLFLLYFCHQHCTSIPEKILVTELKGIRGSNVGKLTVRWAAELGGGVLVSCKTGVECVSKISAVLGWHCQTCLICLCVLRQ